MVIALWHHGGDAWCNAFFLTVANNVNYLAGTDDGFHSRGNRLWQARDTENVKLSMGHNLDT